MRHSAELRSGPEAPFKVHFQFHVISSRANKMEAVTKMVLIWCHLCFLLALSTSESSNATTGLSYFNRSDFNSWIQSRLVHSTSTDKPLRLATHHRLSSGYAIEVTPPPSGQLLQFQAPKRNRANEEATQQQLSPQSAPLFVLSANRSARTAAVAAATGYDEQAEGEDYNLLVSNTCERDHMLVEIKTNKPFFGLVHTLNYRRRVLCTAESEGGRQLKLSISHSLNPSDPQHCGVTRVANQKADGELLSVIVAVRLNRNIELSEDKFFVLNCTNHCRRPDCSSGPSLSSGRLVDDLTKHSAGLRQMEREYVADESDFFSTVGRFQVGARSADRNRQPADCSVWRSAWILALALCLAIILVGMLISNCIICMSLRQKKRSKKSNATRSSQKEAGDLESQQVQTRDRRDERRKSRRKSRQIIYDNEDVNYVLAYPEATTRLGQSDFLELRKQQQEKLKRSQVASTSRASGETSREFR